MGEKTIVHRFSTLFYSVKIAPYVFVLPFIATFLVFFLYPTLNTLFMSFHSIVGVGEWEFVGLENYQRLQNRHFFNALRTSSWFTFYTVILLIPIPLLVAVLLNSSLLPGRNVFRSILFVPSLVSVIVAGVAFRLLFGNTAAGFVNSVLIQMGRAPVRWMLSEPTGMFIMVVLGTWRWAGVNMIYFLSGLQAIPRELYESADIDGASSLRKLTAITIPLLKPISIYVLTISIYGGFSMFTESFVYWNESMPADLGLTMVRYIYQQGLLRNDFGMGSAIGLALLAIVFVVNIIQLAFFGLFRKD